MGTPSLGPVSSRIARTAARSWIRTSRTGRPRSRRAGSPASRRFRHQASVRGESRRRRAAWRQDRSCTSANCTADDRACHSRYRRVDCRWTRCSWREIVSTGVNPIGSLAVSSFGDEFFWVAELAAAGLAAASSRPVPSEPTGLAVRAPTP